ncbi:InlB B-repeat-containing protein [Treponema primitia]|uniref:InlB B-repeat-containing protein n=1 Tax=Treponema primitia TaxID=88058 RepID=UPI0039818799
MLAFTLIGCGDGAGGGKDPTVTSVSVDPATVNVTKGETKAFIATVTGTNDPAQTVTWSVTGGVDGTGFSGATLTVAASETAASLTVTATSTVDTSKSGAATVTVTDSAYNVTYNANTSDSGTVPVDSNSPYQSGGTVTVLDNTGTLAKTDYSFAGWDTAANGSGTSYAAGATFTISADTTLYAKWNFIVTYSLGDTGPGGGKIIYIDPAGFIMADTGLPAHYLEAAPVNQGTELAWASAAYVETDIPGTGADGEIGAEAEIGKGRQNTALILATDAAAPAALACKNYSGGGKTDWFLPSLDELKELYNQRSSLGIADDGFFWSSCQKWSWEGHSESARGLVFITGEVSSNSKINYLSGKIVWALRAF